MFSNFMAKPKNDTIKIDLGESGDFIELKSFSDKKFIDEVSRKSNTKVKTWKKNFKSTKDDKEIKIFCAAMARHLIVDWQLTNNKKQFLKLFPDIAVDSREGLDKKFCNIPFTFSNAYEMLKHKDFEEFFNMVFAETQDKAQFEKDDIDGDLGN